jgi:tetratricopeptide (TPR) repeat protein
VRVMTCAVLSLVVSGCAMHRSAAVAVAPPATETAMPQAQAMPPPQTLESFIAKVRKLSAEARPQRPAATTIEGSDARLAGALAASIASPSPERFREVASEYARIGVTDRAYEYLMRSVTSDPHDAAGYDALARLWRDSGFPQRGLGDAYRAVHYAPASPIVHNTLGTLLQVLGNRNAARLEYERALQLDPTAVYALTNLCYAWLMNGHSGHAETACGRALQLNPRYVPARNNLALAHAVAGDVAAAQIAFEDVDDPAAGIYNIGLVHLARREYTDALESFTRAAALRPTMRLAAARVRQIQQTFNSGAGE